MPKNKEEEYQPVELETELTKELHKYEKRTFRYLIDQIETEWNISYFYMQPKQEEWAKRLKLYNNQKRAKDAVGDPLMFSVHQTVLASLYNDKLVSKFEGTEEGDEDLAENLTLTAENDYISMEKDMLDYEWDWDTSFFGHGLALFTEFDRKLKLPIPECVDMMTWLRDPRAKSVRGDIKGRGRMKFGGREVRLTKQEMRDSGIYFNFEDLKPDGTDDYNSVLDRYSQMRREAQGMGDVSKFDNVKGDNAEYRITEWHTSENGRLIIVGWHKASHRIVRYTKLNGNRLPIIDRFMYPIAHDWDGVSIPDLTEDKQRARSVLQNLGVKVAKSSLYPMYVYNTNKIKNPANLNFEFNKHVGVNGDIANAAAPLQKAQIASDVSWIMESLDTAAQKATATSEMQQGVVGTEKRTATEVNAIGINSNTRYSLTAKVWGWSEKRFWQQWYSLYKENFVAGIDEKIIRIAGPLSYSHRKLTRENLISNLADPDVFVESKAVSDAERNQKINSYRLFIQDAVASDPNTNKRFALRRLGRLSSIPSSEVNMILPPNVDEMTAEEENEGLEQGVRQNVRITDDDIVHMEIHNKASDSAAKYAHIRAHKKAMLMKKMHPELATNQTAAMPDAQQMKAQPNNNRQPALMPQPVQ
jgi:hypothetical protein